MGSETDKNRLICCLLFSEISENTRVTLIILTCCECGVFFSIQTVLIEKMQCADLVLRVRLHGTNAHMLA